MIKYGVEVLKIEATHAGKWPKETETWLLRDLKGFDIKTTAAAAAAFVVFAVLTSVLIFPGNLTLNACDSLVNTAAVCKSSAAPARHEWTQEKGEQCHKRAVPQPPPQNNITMDAEWRQQLL